MFISVDRNLNISLTRQIYTSIREQIISGALAANTKLPATRELSSELLVSRNIIRDVYAQLEAEGYLITKERLGTFVPPLPIKAAISEASYGCQNRLADNPQPKYCFRTGIPALSKIPVEKWAYTYRYVVSGLSPDRMDYQEPQGEKTLRKELTEYLYRFRGVETTAENIIITTGSAESFNLILSLFPKDGKILVENPLSSGLLHTIQQYPVKIVPIPVDENGLMTNRLTENGDCIFTTPSHQFPTGAVLPIGRRIELVNYALAHDAYIVEDDYDSEFRYGTSPIDSLQHLCKERVIYVGSFSKTFMPALRLGYMVVPDALLPSFMRAKYLWDIHTTIPEQRTMAEFIHTGKLEGHIRKMKKWYKTVRTELVGTLESVFGNQVKCHGDSAGLHLMAEFPGRHFAKSTLEKLQRNGFSIQLASSYCMGEDIASRYDSSFLFGFGNMNPVLIPEAIARLKTLL